MKNPFKRFTIALTGEFGQGRSHEKMKDWIEANGGTFARQISSDVTHLVCSLKDWKKAPKIVKEALKVKKLKIVTFDWFEDSLMQHSPKREGPYLLKRVAKKTRKQIAQKKSKVKRAVKEGSKAFEKGCKAFNDEIHAQGYHIYRDETNFDYQVVLARADLATNKNERYTLKACIPLSISHALLPSHTPPTHPPKLTHSHQKQLYESHTPPHLYATYATYSSALTSTTIPPTSTSPSTTTPDGPSPMKATIHRTLATASDIRAPVGSTFETAFLAFRRFFKAKTGRGWEERFEEGGGKGMEGRFVYVPPPVDGGMGRGVVPLSVREGEGEGEVGMDGGEEKGVGVEGIVVET